MTLRIEKDSNGQRTRIRLIDRILLIIIVAPFALAQYRKLPPDVKLSEGSNLDKVRPDITG